MARELFDRAWRVRVDGDEVASDQGSRLDVAFQIMKSTKREPNTCQLAIWNLHPDRRTRIESGRDVRVEVAAGYKGSTAPPLLFRGDIRNARSPRGGTVSTSTEQVDRITEVEARDGGRSYLAARVSKSFGPGTPTTDVLNYLADSMGVGRGNVGDFAGYQLETGGSNFRGAVVLDGQAHRELHTILRSLGLRWSIQNGVLQIMRRRTPLSTEAAVISTGTGMVGSPTAETGGIVKVNALLRPGLDPGRKVKLESAQFTGFYEIKKATYVGDTRATNWYARLELKSYA